MRSLPRNRHHAAAALAHVAGALGSDCQPTDTLLLGDSCCCARQRGMGRGPRPGAALNVHPLCPAGLLLLLLLPVLLTGVYLRLMVLCTCSLQHRETG